MAEGWPAKELSHEYGSDDHLTRANFEADVHRFGYDKTVAQVLQLNQLLKAAKNFPDFQAEAGKVLANLNGRNLQTEYETAKATAVSTANVLRAVAGGAKFMRHRATLDTHTRPVHAALNDKVWRIDDPNDTEWRKWVVPLGWRCRCHDLFEDDAAAADLITATDAERLVGPDEMLRLTRDGFLQDRVAKKALFTSKQSYLDGLKDPDKVNFKLGDMTYADQGQQPWAQLDKAGLPALSVPAKTKADALADFAATAQHGAKEYADYSGRPLFLPEQDLLDHLEKQYLTPKQNRQGLYFKLAEVLADPDEVYFFDFPKDNAPPLGKLSYTYLKFYQDDVLLVAVEFDKAQPQTIKTWYGVHKPDERRKGLLIHKK